MAVEPPRNGSVLMDLLEAKSSHFQLERKVSRTISNGSPDSLIHLLGQDHLVLILDRLSVRSVLSFGLTCKQARELANSDAVWGPLCRREWGPQASELEPVVKRVQGGWKEVYRQLTTLGSAHWQQLQTGEQMPCRRASHSLVLADKELVTLAGGCDGGRDLNDTWIADPSPLIQHPINAPPLTWHQSSSSDLPGRFGQLSVFVPGCKTIVVFGGINDRGLRLNDTWAFDDLTGSGECSWRKLDLLQSPLPRGAPGGCYGGEKKVVLFGGLAQDNARYADTWVLDFELEPLSWRKLELESGPQARSGHAMTWLGDGRIVLFGGRNMVFEMLNDVWLLDMHAAGGPIWQEIWAPERFPSDEAPVARSGHTATAVVGGKVIVVGGEDMSRNRKGDVWLLDPNAGAVPAKREGLVAQSFNGGASQEGPFSLSSEPLENGSSQEGPGIVPEAPAKLPPKVWQRLQVAGQGPSKRSFHTATRLAGSSILLFGGMVDGELLPGQAGGLKFDDEMWLLDLVS